MSSTRDIANEVRPFAVALDLAEWRPKYRQEATVLIPVTCPQCGEASLSAHPVVVVVTALTQWNRMLLRAACHEQAWNATHAELQAIREHLGEDWISKNAKSSGTR
jgi:hypothetical protein